MLAEQLVLLPEFAQTIERHIRQRTWDRVQHLRVEVRPDRVAVRGQTSSFYQKQQALCALMETLGSDCRIEIDLDIQVGPSTPRGSEGRDGPRRDPREG